MTIAGRYCIQYRRPSRFLLPPLYAGIVIFTQHSLVIHIPRYSVVPEQFPRAFLMEMDGFLIFIAAIHFVPYSPVLEIFVGSIISGAIKVIYQLPVLVYPSAPSLRGAAPFTPACVDDMRPSFHGFSVMLIKSSQLSAKIGKSDGNLFVSLGQYPYSAVNAAVTQESKKGKVYRIFHYIVPL